MKIVAPSLKLNMELQDVEIREGKPVIVCRVGVYDATADLSTQDTRAIFKCLLRPRTLLAFIKLLIGR